MHGMQLLLPMYGMQLVWIAIPSYINCMYGMQFGLQ